MAKVDPYVYGEYVFGYEPAPHHRQMVDFVLDHIDRRERAVLLAPRNSAKTTWCNTILLSWLVATRPDIRIGLFSNVDKKAWAMSSAIRWVLSENEDFKEIFGDLRSPGKWTDSEWFRRDSPHHNSKDRTMVAAGVNPNAVSKRFDVIFCDDVLDEVNTYTLEQREKVESWFWKSLKPTQAAEGAAVIVLGTRWVEDDLYQRLIEANKWDSLVIPAIKREEETLVETSYWPAVWPLERLYAEREDVGWDNFACSYLNDISGFREGTIFRKEWFDYFDELPVDRHYTLTMGVDLATSVRERADWTARAIVAKDDRGEHWILSTSRMKTETGHRAFVEAGYASYPNISRIVIEDNQAQSILVNTLLAETNMPVVGQRTDVDMRRRARAVATRYESHRIHHHRSLKGGELETEMLNFDKGHDDLISALGMAMQLGHSAGSIAVVTGEQTVTRDPAGALVHLPEGRELPFITGGRIVPDHVAALLGGIDTTQYTYEEAMQHANQRRLNDYIKAQMSGILHG